MQQNDGVDRAWALLFARLVLGFFFMAGVWKVFPWAVTTRPQYFLPFADTFLPVWSLCGGVTIPSLSCWLAVW